jgi:hypothetical protein
MIYTGRQKAKPGDKESRPEIQRIPGPIILHPNVVAHGKRKDNAPNMSAEN